MIAIGGAGSLARSLGEPGGRAIVADAIGQHLRNAPLVTDAAMHSWSAPELASVSLWLRDVTTRTCDALGDVDPCMLVPARTDAHAWKSLRSWELAHQFLAGCGPAVGDGIQICCQGCLLDMTAALGVCASQVTILQWGGDPGVEAYVTGGGELPARARPPAEAPAPSADPYPAQPAFTRLEDIPDEHFGTMPGTKYLRQ